MAWPPHGAKGWPKPPPIVHKKFYELWIRIIFSLQFAFRDSWLRYNGLHMLPDSLGLLDLDIPSSKYHDEDLILSDSLSSLNRLIASNLDAFQNCSFFGLEKKESTGAEAQETTSSFSNFKIGSGVWTFYVWSLVRIIIFHVPDLRGVGGRRRVQFKWNHSHGAKGVAVANLDFFKKIKNLFKWLCVNF